MRGRQKKKDSRIKGEESCWAQEGRITSRGPTIEQHWGLKLLLECGEGG